MKGRHPHRSEARALWDAEEKLLDKREEIRKQERELQRKLAELVRDREALEDGVMQQKRALAKKCNVGPDTMLDSTRLKWMVRDNPTDEKAAPRVIDFNQDENPEPPTEAEPAKNGEAKTKGEQKESEAQS